MAKVIGIEKVNYISKKTGKEVNGYNIYYSYPLTKEGSEGTKADHEYINADLFNSKGIMVGDEVEFQYNKFGSVTDIRVI